MSTATVTPPLQPVPVAPPAPAPAPPKAATRRGRLYRLSVRQYHRMIDAGVLREGAKVELIDGLLVRKPMTRKPPHDASLDLLEDRLRRLLPDGWIARGQKAVTFPRGEPEPDVCVAVGPIERYLYRHPRPADIALVCEVSDTTLRTDRGLKLRNYARAGVAVYWVVNLVAGEVEVYADPHAPAKRRPRYRSLSTFAAGQAVPLVLNGTPAGSVAVSDVIR